MVGTIVSVSSWSTFASPGPISLPPTKSLLDALLLSDLIERGLEADRARLWVIDGGKTLRKAIVECFGTLALTQRCREHKRRNVIERLPEQLQANVGRALRDAWDSDNATLARRQLKRVAASLDAQHPGAAASLREGLEAR